MDAPGTWGRDAGELSLQDYVAIFARRRWLILIVFLATLIAALAWNLVAPRTYESTASVLLRTQNNDQLFPSVPNSQRNDFLRRDIAEFDFVSSTAFTRQAEAVAPESASVQPRIDEDQRTSLLDFVARAPDPAQAQSAAAAWAETYLSVRRATAIDRIEVALLDTEVQMTELEIVKAEILEPLKPIEDALLTETDSDTISRLTTQRLSLKQALEDELLPVSIQLRELSQNAARLRIAESLVERDNVSELLSTEPGLGQQVAPNVARNMALAAVLGAMLAAGAALVVESLTSVIRTSADLERLAPQVPVLAQIPDVAKNGLTPGQAIIRNGTPYAEAHERLLSALLYRRVGLPDNRLKVLVTSALPGEGKTTITSNLGHRLFGTNMRSVLIDGDLRRPQLHRAFGLPQRTGLAEVLLGTARVEEQLMPLLGSPRMRFLSAGTPTNEAAALLRESFASLVDQLPHDYDMLVVDAPPVLAVTDVEVIADSVDAVLLVVRAEATKSSQIEQAVRRLEAVNAPLAGFVLLGVRDEAERGYYYSYYSDEAEAVVSDSFAPEQQLLAPTRGVRPRRQAAFGATAALTAPENGHNGAAPEVLPDWLSATGSGQTNGDRPTNSDRPRPTKKKKKTKPPAAARSATTSNKASAQRKKPRPAATRPNTTFTDEQS